jgi:hypothetical protein
MAATPTFRRTVTARPLAVAAVSAIAVVALAAGPVRAQSLMVGADGVIHLDGPPGGADSPVVIEQTPELIQPSIVPLEEPAGGESGLVGGPEAFSAYSVPFVPYTPSVAPLVQQPLPIKYALFGEFLYLRPTGLDVAHAQQVSGPGNAVTHPQGLVGVADFHYEPGVRIGGDLAVSPTTSLAASYTWFESSSVSRVEPAVTPAAFDGVASLVHHPDFASGVAAGPVDARSFFDFQIADGEYRVRLRQGPRYWVNGGLGLRYGRLEHRFTQSGPFILGDVTTDATAKFDGGGPKLAIDGGRNLGAGGFSFYGRAGVSPLAGEFRSHYALRNDVASDVLQLDWSDNRIVTLLDYEFGLAWTGPRKRWRFAAGYVQSFWFNAVTAGDAIGAAQSGDFTDIDSTIMLDGLTARAEHFW